jgi:polyphosphate kinase
VTARFYTDVGLFTADQEMTGAVHDVFSFLTAYSEQSSYAPLTVSPVNLAENCLDLIAREADHARLGRPARIIAKMNALLDKNIIAALYRASQAGVEIDLIVRGMCALRPGIRGISDRIRVRSIVGRFLEHSRIFSFANGGQDAIYLASADWMPRNLYERVEVMFPVRDPLLRERLRQEILDAYLADTVKARVLRRDGSYIRAWKAAGKHKPPVPGFNAQDFLLAVAEGKQSVAAIPVPYERRISHARTRKAAKAS